MLLHAFDLDKTLLNDNCSRLFSDYLWRKKLISPLQRLICLITYLRYKFFLAPPHKLHVAAFKHMFFQKSAQFFEEQATLFWQTHFETCLNAKAVERLKKARSNNELCILMSSSPHFLVKPIAHLLGFEIWYATVYEEDENRCFNRIASLIDGKSKAQHLLRLCRQLSIPIGETKAYSDSFDDIPLLSTAGCAIAVNPDQKLRAHCQKFRWEIL